MKIIFYTPKILPRIQYIVRFVLEKQLHLSLHWTNDADFFATADTPKLNYSQQRISLEELFLPMHALLEETTIIPQPIEIFHHRNLPAFFEKIMPEADLPFDLFAFLFYLLSRYEEYLPFQADAHDRFPAKESLAFKADFLERPLVDLWILELQQLLAEKFSTLTFSKRRTTFSPTYDIDQAWAYRHKNWWRTLGGFVNTIRHGNWAALQHRWQVFNKKADDPFFTFPYLDQLHDKFGWQPIYFFLLGNYSTFDKNIAPQHPAFQQLIHQLGQRYRLGIHPSYQSNEDPNLLAIEIARLKQLTAYPITKSRQHYLKLRLPQTYRRLVAVGIQEDYTMGYADAVGFRASTAQAFNWYDLEKETPTNLRIVPFQAMDVTLKQYLKQSPDEALVTLERLFSSLEKTGGIFVTLWHNSSFADTEGWAGWRAMYEQFLELVQNKLG